MSFARVVLHNPNSFTGRTADVYTEINADSKGISIGVYSPGKDKELRKAIDGAQPYVDLMGRR